jgi:hypothetical protein
MLPYRPALKTYHCKNSSNRRKIVPQIQKVTKNNEGSNHMINKERVSDYLNVTSHILCAWYYKNHEFLFVRKVASEHQYCETRMVKVHSDVMENKRSKHYLAYFGRLNRGRPSFRTSMKSSLHWGLD